MDEKLSAKIGFLIDPSAPVKRQIAYILTADGLQTDLWDTWVPCGDDRKAQDSAQEYAEALFLATTYALRGARIVTGTKQRARKQEEKTGAIEILETEPLLGHWVRRIYNVVNAPGEYDAIPPRLRKDLSLVVQTTGSRARLRGARPKPADRTVLIAGDYERRIFYWDVRQEPFASMDIQGYWQRNEPLHISPVTPNSFAAGQIIALAEQIRQGSTAKTWQDLYRQAAVDIDYASSAKWLQITSRQVEGVTEERRSRRTSQAGFSVESSHLTFTGPPLEFPEVVKQQKGTPVLLTGPSGSGKTTAFRLLVDSWMGPDQPQDNLCFHITLQDAEDYLERQIRRRQRISIADLIGRTVASMLLQRCDEQDLLHCRTARNLPRQRRGGVTRVGDILSPIHQEVTRWFHECGCEQDNVVILIDGMNELRSHLRPFIRKGMVDLTGKPCRLAVACRSNIVGEVFSSTREHFVRFELQELDRQQIIDYIDCRIHGQGEYLFETQIRHDTRVLSMAHNPFCLTLITEEIRKNAAIRLPATKADLIERFILDSIRRKREEHRATRQQHKDDLMFIILPHVAKWSIRVFTLAEDEGAIPFTQSEEAHSVRNHPDFLTTLEIAEGHGLLRASGLLEESRQNYGYPAFSHDNFRDFFAALYLRTLGERGLVEHLPEIVEHFAWDEPVLLFLELCPSRRLTRKIIEFILPIDPFFAAACLRRAKVVDETFLLEMIGRLLEAPFGKGLLWGVIRQVRDVLHVATRHPATYALGRLPVERLVAIWQDRSQNEELRELAMYALFENSTSRDLPVLKELWAQEYKARDVGRMSIPFSLIAHIPTREAHDFVMAAYAQASSALNRGNVSRDSGSRGLESDRLLETSIAYSPTFAEVVAKFPPEDYPRQFIQLLGAIRSPATPQEIERIRSLVDSDDLELAGRASEVLARVAGVQAVPTLLDRFHAIKEMQLKKFRNRDFSRRDRWKVEQFQWTLLCLCVDLAPDQVAPVLLAEIEEQTSRVRAFSTAWEVRRDPVRLLARTHVPQALEYFTRKACTDWPWDQEAAAFYTDRLLAWPDRACAMQAVEHYCHGGDPKPRMARLLAAWLGSDKYARDAEAIFNDLFERGVRDVHLPPPHPVILEVLFKSDPRRWHKFDRENALSMLPAALRAVRKTPSKQTMEKITEIITWAVDELCAADLRESRIDKGERTSFIMDSGAFIEYVTRSLSEAVRSVRALVRVHYPNQKLQRALAPDTIAKLLSLVNDSNITGAFVTRAGLEDAFLDLCEGIPGDYVSVVFSLARQYLECHLKVFTQDCSSHNYEPNWPYDALICLCERIDQADVLNFLTFLDGAFKQITSSHGHHVMISFIHAIKLIRGRRFLSKCR